MGLLSIGQLAARTEVSTSTIRFYESVGLLLAPERRSGQRRYDEQIIDRIHFVKVAQQTGFTIQEITLLLEGFEPGYAMSSQWELMARQKRSELEERKNQILSMIQILDNGLSCQCLDWTECREKIESNGTC